jgi:hypothetical protein
MFVTRRRGWWWRRSRTGITIKRPRRDPNGVAERVLLLSLRHTHDLRLGDHHLDQTKNAAQVGEPRSETKHIPLSGRVGVDVAGDATVNQQLEGSLRFPGVRQYAAELDFHRRRESRRRRVDEARPPHDMDATRRDG